VMIKQGWRRTRLLHPAMHEVLARKGRIPRPYVPPFNSFSSRGEAERYFRIRELRCFTGALTGSVGFESEKMCSPRLFPVFNFVFKLWRREGILRHLSGRSQVRILSGWLRPAGSSADRASCSLFVCSQLFNFVLKAVAESRDTSQELSKAGASPAAPIDRGEAKVNDAKASKTLSAFVPGFLYRMKSGGDGSGYFIAKKIPGPTCSPLFINLP